MKIVALFLLGLAVSQAAFWNDLANQVQQAIEQPIRQLPVNQRLYSFQDFGNTMKNLGSEIRTTAEQFGNEVRQGVSDAHLADRAQQLGEKLKAAGEQLIENVQTHLEAVGHRVSASDLADRARQMENTMMEAGRRFSNDVGSMARGAVDEVRSGRLGHRISEEAHRDMERAREIGQQVAGDVVDTAEKVAAEVRSGHLGRDIVEGARHAAETIAHEAQVGFGRARDYFQQARKNACGACHRAVDRARDRVHNKEDAIEQFALDACEYVMAKYYSQCMMKIARSAPQVIHALENGLSNQQICTAAC